MILHLQIPEKYHHHVFYLFPVKYHHHVFYLLLLECLPEWLLSLMAVQNVQFYFQDKNITEKLALNPTHLKGWHLNV